MRKAKRIGLSLFDDDVKEMIQSGLSVLPITQEMVDGNLNPNNLVYGRVDRRIYMWLEGHWDYIIADDINIKWADVKDKPTSYTPSEHSHSELHTHSNKTILDRVVDDNIHGHNNKPVLDSITSLLISTWNTVTGKADKTYVDTELDKKSNTAHTHPYSLDTHVHDERYYTEAEVDTKVTDINSAIDNKSDRSHNHDGAYWKKTTPLPKGDKGDKPAHQWVGTSLAFENPNGVMGVAVDLKGDKGDKGDTGEQGNAGAVYQLATPSSDNVIWIYPSEESEVFLAGLNYFLNLPESWARGSMLSSSNNTEIESQTRLRTTFMEVYPNEIYTLTVDDGYVAWCPEFDENFINTARLGADLKMTQTFTTTPTTKYIRVVIGKKDAAYNSTNPDHFLYTTDVVYIDISMRGDIATTIKIPNGSGGWIKFPTIKGDKGDKGDPGNTPTWNDVIGKPATFPPSTHSHDDKYYTESEIDSKLSAKADGTTVSGHTGNSTVHVTSTDKAYWNGKANLADIPAPYTHPGTHPYSMLTGVPTIPTTTNQLTNNSGFITISSVPTKLSQLEADVELGGNFATIGTVKPTDGSMWYEEI